ncbi:hypothetical protein H6F77_26890 [Microcoleus sp. FACHB-831]|uniref:KGK domain-containing protein n=1 Tax=Microcoleus sp. FACHB-831 TaxID=2692827 RepID=UPI0016889111|nr:KGK domain-containing protein [Microcoleus sp. FACHB-831]MBD1924658.1 hypothetical protein [Microcoleus sp. FACHB-831]
MENKFEPLAKGEVLSVEEDSQILIGHRTFRVGEFSKSMRDQLEYGLGKVKWTEETEGWFSDNGINCEVLKFGSDGWQKGKVRISLEFCPQDTEVEFPEPPTPAISLDEEEPELAAMLIIEEEPDFPEIMAIDEEEPEFAGISDNNQLEDMPQNSLLDDVWQDMNQASWPENQY